MITRDSVTFFCGMGALAVIVIWMNIEYHMERRRMTPQERKIANQEEKDDMFILIGSL